MLKKSTLEKLYVTQNLWISEIAEAKDLEYGEVVSQLKHHGIPIRDPQDPGEWCPDWLHAQYWEKGRTLTDIATAEKEAGRGCTSATVLAKMADFGIPRRKKGARSATTWTAKLDPIDVVLIRRLATDGVKQSKIRGILAEGGKEITKQALSKIVRGETWKDVTDEGTVSLAS